MPQDTTSETDDPPGEPLPKNLPSLREIIWLWMSFCLIALGVFFMWDFALDLFSNSGKEFPYFVSTGCEILALAWLAFPHRRGADGPRSCVTGWLAAATLPAIISLLHGVFPLATLYYILLPGLLIPLWLEWLSSARADFGVRILHLLTGSVALMPALLIFAGAGSLLLATVFIGNCRRAFRRTCPPALSGSRSTPSPAGSAARLGLSFALTAAAGWCFFHAARSPEDSGSSRDPGLLCLYCLLHWIIAGIMIGAWRHSRQITRVCRP